MNVRISPLWWPVLAISSPVTVPLLLTRNRRFRENEARAAALNRQRLDHASRLDLPALDFLELDVLVEWRAEPEFLGDAGVSYLLRSDLGSVLFDVGFGPASPTLMHNAEQLEFDADEVDALVISHLHLDHMGGLAGQRAREVQLPDALVPSQPRPCFLPEEADISGFEPRLVDGPQLLSAGIASTGPLARSLFVLGYIEEQALLARIRGKGLVVLTGCGHPGVEVILDMVRHLSDEPLYGLGGGLHFPIKKGRGGRAGIDLQNLMGTGKPPWQRITDDDLSRAIAAINAAGPQRVVLSGHDTGDYALARMQEELEAETQVLKAGASYRF
jgi:7,8-dihydropterin-6-yl-methyl-4-(beta-D-ribofuranosyl)aminobenzene 5'-phosphate synthase